MQVPSHCLGLHSRAVSKQMLPSVDAQITVQATERAALMLQEGTKRMAQPVFLCADGTHEANP